MTWLLAAEQLSVATRWLLLSTLVAGFSLGWQAKNYYRRKEYLEIIDKMNKWQGRAEEWQSRADQDPD